MGENIKPEVDVDDFSMAFGQAAGGQQGEAQESDAGDSTTGADEGKTEEREQGQAADVQGQKLLAEAKAEAEKPEEGQGDPELLKQAMEAGQKIMDARGTSEKPAAVQADQGKEVQKAEDKKPDKVETKEQPAVPAEPTLELSIDTKEFLQDFPQIEEYTKKYVDQRVTALLGTLGLTKEVIRDLMAVPELAMQAVDRARAVDFEYRLTRVIPEAIEIASSKEYLEWIAKEPKQVKELHQSANVEDAVRVLRLYQSIKSIKSSKANGQAAAKIVDVYGHSISGRSGATKDKPQSADDFSAAFLEAAKGMN